MKTTLHAFLAHIIVPTILILHTTTIKSQVCDNLALAFDGNGDYINLNLAGTSFLSNDNFTAEAWVTSTSAFTNCSGIFRRLFSFSGTAPNSRFEVGECNSIIFFYWNNTTGGGPAQPFATVPFSPGCHHMAVVRTGDAMDFYLDGTNVYSVTGIGILNSTLFQVGTWQGGPQPGADWEGEVDEIRLWNVARTANQILDYKDCTLSTSTGSIPGLVANWTFDQTITGVIPGGNNTGVLALDMSGNTPPNDGTLIGFDLTLGNFTSNFICNSCSPVYQLDITDFPSQFPVSLVSICEGDYVQFCVTQNGIPINLPSGAMVMWESTDGILPFAPDPDLANYQNASNALCFPAQPGLISGNCINNTQGFTDRKYRAVIQKKMGNQICTFKTPEKDLQICCKVTNAQIIYIIQPPTPFNSTICQGPVTIDIALLSTDPFITNPLPAGTSIQWCIDGVHQAQYDNLLSFTYTGIAIAPNLCFEAKIYNCSCPVYTSKICIPVDPVPACGLIDALSSPASLMPDPLGGQYDYLICPGDHAAIGMLIPTAFQNCNPVWQYHFDSDPPGFPNWLDMGTSNSVQNTNTLPQVIPPNLPNPSIWPPLATCIYYRIECRPLTWPNSGCDPCHSNNEVRICLKQSPSIPVITSSANQICKGNSATLSTLTIPGALLYTWYCNGAVIASGPFATSVTVMQDACYEVSVFDGCFTVVSAKFCLEVCAILPIITCPIDNPCACDGLPITLIGCNSYNTCFNTGPLPLVFTWSADNGGPGTPTGLNGCEFIHTPDPGGTTYTLTVTDPNLGCSATKTLTIYPCL